MSERKPALVALREERQTTLKALTDAFASDLLDVDEYEERVGKAHSVDTCEALVALRSDVVAVTQEPQAASPSQALTKLSTEEQQALIAKQPKSRWAVAIMGGIERKGIWRVPKKLRVAAVMGGAELDFREAVLAPGVSEIKVISCMGGVEIIVPPDLAVECDGIGIMGGFELMDRQHVGDTPDRPVLRISGAAIMGGVNVKTRLVGESARQARKRHKQERKAQLKAARQRAELPEKTD